MVSTPYMDEAALCDRVALIHQGKILEIDRPQHLVQNYPYALFALRGDDMFGLLQSARDLTQVKTVYPFGDVHHLVMPCSADPAIVGKYLKDQGFQGVSLWGIRPEIEDCFIAQMKV